jgi:hypothetical protein
VSRQFVVCADVGSTYTKVAVVDLTGGELVATAARPTTIGTDVLEGLDEAVRAAGGAGYPLLVCSSAGGGLRLAVVGYERLVTGRAAEQVGLSAGARVVHVAAGPLDGAARRAAAGRRHRRWGRRGAGAQRAAAGGRAAAGTGGGGRQRRGP